ncbi:MAG: 4-hydroxy-3-methylbut-2-enyl diphosphate reductase [Bacteroidales bacterium]|nr:4-hydroxy-3-methylbut-2-enyl diphosphate reductase [Bacteroidales bacterium]
MFRIVVDPDAGPCMGVKRAIEMAETELARSNQLYCVGEILHNTREMDRLVSLGLQTITPSGIGSLPGERIMFRSHGEPPETYQKARHAGAEILDATCPVVTQLQLLVRKSWLEMKKVNGTAVIFGKPDHPEVISLLGFADGKAQVINGINEAGLIDINRPVVLLSQTTMNRKEYHSLVKKIRHRMISCSIHADNLRVHDTICKKVSAREKGLKDFCRKHDLIIFVGGKHSSNSRYLFGTCHQVNRNSHWIEEPGEVESSWAANNSKTGITGGNSTPIWILNEVAATLQNMRQCI